MSNIGNHHVNIGKLPEARKWFQKARDQVVSPLSSRRGLHGFNPSKQFAPEYHPFALDSNRSAPAQWQKAAGTTSGPEMDPFLQFVLEIGHVTPDIRG